MKEDLKNEEESKNISPGGPDISSQSSDTNSLEQNSVQAEKTAVEKNNNPALTTDSEKNTEVEKTESLNGSQC